MSPEQIVAAYRRYAADCVEIARDLEPGRRLALLNVAQAWLNLAEQIAKNSQTTLVYETPVRPPTAAADRPSHSAPQQQPQRKTED